MLGFGKGVRAVGAVCGGSQPGVSRGDPAFSSGSGRKKDKIDLLEEILHISFQPPTSLLQSPQCVLSYSHPSVKTSVPLSQSCSGKDAGDG